SFPMVRSDKLKFGVSWGSPPDNARRSQTVVEILYRWHLTHNITFSPDLQVTFNPSFKEEKDTIYIIGTRFRYNF
ncbi:MAG: carbohydrate porin, partial [Betaproteobacteria bacterium]